MVKYNEAELEVIRFDVEDVIVTSCTTDACFAYCPDDDGFEE